MFHHSKDLQFNARVSRPDPAFANILLEQFGGENGELAAAMQYFTQAFGAKQPHPDKYDMLMDIATEEFSHLEIVGATIQMLLKGVNHLRMPQTRVRLCRSWMEKQPRRQLYMPPYPQILNFLS
jgi:Mn-containing catalase